MQNLMDLMSTRFPLVILYLSYRANDPKGRKYLQVLEVAYVNQFGIRDRVIF